jgi:hypothetical protein
MSHEHEVRQNYSAAYNTKWFNDDGWCHLVCCTSCIIWSFGRALVGTTTPLCGSVRNTNNVSIMYYLDKLIISYRYFILWMICEYRDTTVTRFMFSQKSVESCLFLKQFSSFMARWPPILKSK